MLLRVSQGLREGFCACTQTRTPSMGTHVLCRDEQVLGQRSPDLGFRARPGARGEQAPRPMAAGPRPQARAGHQEPAPGGPGCTLEQPRACQEGPPAPRCFKSLPLAAADGPGKFAAGKKDMSAALQAESEAKSRTRPGQNRALAHLHPVPQTCLPPVTWHLKENTMPFKSKTEPRVSGDMWQFEKLLVPASGTK